MNMLRCEGSAIMYGDDYALIKFDKGCISFDNNGELYTNLSEIIIKSDINGKVENNNIRYPILINRGTKRKTVFNYMLSTLLMWDDWALLKEIKKIVGVKDEICSK